jgi:hypothetical protein
MAAGAWKCLTAWIACRRALLPFIVRSPWLSVHRLAMNVETSCIDGVSGA